MTHIQSVDNPLVKNLVKLRTDSTSRRAEGKVLLVGRSLIAEAAQHTPLQLLITKEDDPPLPAKKTMTASPAVLKKISGVETPDGYIAVVDLPKEATLTSCRSVLALDGVSDPGNFGTLLRSALAFAWEGIFLLPNSCDPYNEKALRAARGAQLHLPLKRGSWEQLKDLCHLNKMTPIVAELHGDDIRTLMPPSNPLLILGNEGQGINPIASAWCRKVTIPMTSNMESLNVSVAGSILMFLLNNPSGPHV